jgi:hypothetical protein
MAEWEPLQPDSGRPVDRNLRKKLTPSCLICPQSAVLHLPRVSPSELAVARVALVGIRLPTVVVCNIVKKKTWRVGWSSS